jgi:hypothetical protein
MAQSLLILKNAICNQILPDIATLPLTLQP